MNKTSSKHLLSITFTIAFVLVALVLFLSAPEKVNAAQGFAVSINFQPSTSTNEPGYLPDYGYVIGDRGNGYFYGWNVDNSAHTFDRGNAYSDRKIDTGNKMQPSGTSRYWEIEVPQGVYDVRLIAADPSDQGGLGTRYNINVEGVPHIVNGVPVSTNWIFGLTQHSQVTVLDGRLTISNGVNATNNSICFIEIKQVTPIYWGSTIHDNADLAKAPFDYTNETHAGVLGYFESHTGKKISIMHWGDSWSNASIHSYNPFHWNTNAMTLMRARGSIPLYTWLPEGAANDPAFKLTNIINGVHDTYISNWASEAKAYGKPFFLRFGHEMNGDWYTWSEINPINTNAPAGSFTNMWRHVHNIFTNVGATNVTWVWCPNVDETGMEQPLSKLYPGSNYVDWVGFDGYNFGGTSFSNVYTTTYNELATIAPGKPIMIAEVGTASSGAPPANSKPAWITDALAQIPVQFPNIKAFVWFNWNAGDTNRNWPIEGGSNTLPYATAPIDWVSVAAYSNGIASAYYLSNQFTNLSGFVINPIVLPDIPANLTATATGTQIALSWSAAANATTYIVYRTTNFSLGVTPLVTNSTPGYTNTGLATGTTFTYVVTSHNLAGESLDSAQASATTIPSAPGGLIATTASNTQINLSWTADAGAATYNIKRGTATGGPYTNIATGVTLTTYSSSGLSASTTYYYVISGVNSAGESGNSGQASATTYPNPPPAPTGLSATAVSSSQINLTWNTSSGATSYNVKLGTASGGPYTNIATGVTLTSYSSTGLAASTAYYYVVSGVDAGGEGANSGQTNATTWPPIPAPPAGLIATPVSSSQINLSWTASSGATSYNLKQSTTSGGPYTTIAPGVTGTTYNNVGLSSSTTYYYVVSALNISGESANGSQTAGTTSESGTGLVHRWQLDNDFTDSIGTNNGINTGVTFTNAAAVGTAAGVFDGASFVDLSSNDFGNSFSIAAWVWIDPTASNIVTIAANSFSGGTSAGFRFFVNSFDTADRKVTFETGNGTATDFAATSTNAVTLGAWNHLAVVVNRTAGTAAIYVNGTNQTVDGTIRTDFTANADTYLGQMEGNVWRFKGRMDEVRVYNRDLTQSEVTDLLIVSHRWPLDGNFQDFAGANTGVNTGVTFTNLARIGSQAGVFNGSNSVSVGNVIPGNSFSLSAWVWVAPAATNIQTAIANTGSGGTQNGFKLFVNTWNTSDGKVAFETGNGTATASATSTAGAVTPGAWNQIVATVDRVAGIATIYVNHSNVTSVSTIRTDFANTNTVNLGQMPDGNWHFDGFLDDPRVYNKVLSATEVGNVP